ncbi:hypothetical protein [Caballeronia grimmiae]
MSIEDGLRLEDELDVVEGSVIERGYLSALFAEPEARRLKPRPATIASRI